MYSFSGLLGLQQIAWLDLTSWRQNLEYSGKSLYLWMTYWLVLEWPCARGSLLLGQQSCYSQQVLQKHQTLMTSQQKRQSYYWIYNASNLRKSLQSCRRHQDMRIAYFQYHQTHTRQVRSTHRCMGRILRSKTSTVHIFARFQFIICTHPRRILRGSAGDSRTRTCRCCRKLGNFRRFDTSHRSTDRELNTHKSSSFSTTYEQAYKSKGESMIQTYSGISLRSIRHHTSTRSCWGDPRTFREHTVPAHTHWCPLKPNAKRSQKSIRSLDGEH